MGVLSSYINFLAKIAEKDIENSVNQLLPRSKKIKYLDCGCDDGFKTLNRAKIIGTDKILGLEIVSERAKKAEEKGIKVIRSNLNYKWTIRTNSIDCITATEVIEHLIDIDNFLSECWRVLKKNGSIILSTENLAGYQNIWALLLGNQPYTGPYLSRYFPVGHRPCAKYYKESIVMDPHLSVMTAKSLQQLLKLYRFTIEEIVPVAFYPFPPPLSFFLSKIDRNHASYILIKARK